MDTKKLEWLYNQAFNATPLSFKRDLVRYVESITHDKNLYSTVQEQVNNAKTQSLQQLLELTEAARQDMLQTVNNLAAYLDTVYIRKHIETSSDLEFVKDDLDDEVAKVVSKITEDKLKQFLRFDKNQNFVGWHSENYQKYLSEKAKVQHTLDFQIWFHWDSLFNYYIKATDYKKNWLKKGTEIERYKDHLQAFHSLLSEQLDVPEVKTPEKTSYSHQILHTWKADEERHTGILTLPDTPEMIFRGGVFGGLNLLLNNFGAYVTTAQLREVIAKHLQGQGKNPNQINISKWKSEIKTKRPAFNKYLKIEYLPSDKHRLIYQPQI